MTAKPCKSDSIDESSHKLTKEELYRRQMKLLDTFLSHGTITKAQYNKSAHDLTEKMGMNEASKPDQ